MARSAMPTKKQCGKLGQSVAARTQHVAVVQRTIADLAPIVAATADVADHRVNHDSRTS